MRFFRVLAVLCLMLAGFAGSGRAEGGGALTLQECVDIAVERSPILKAARADVRATGYRRDEAFAGFFPRLEAGYSYQYNHHVPAFVIPGMGEVSIGSQDQYSAFVGLTQPIFAGGSIYYNHELAKLGVDTSNLNCEQLKLDLILSVKTTYYAILGAEKNKLEAEQAVKRLESHLADAQGLFSAGVIAKNDVLQSEVKLAQGRQDLVRAEQALKLNTAQLNMLLTNRIDAPAVLADILEYEPYPATFEDELEKAYKQRPEIAAARSAIQQREKSVELSKSTYYPDINLVLRYQKEADTALLSKNPYGLNENVTALATMSWTFWEWGKTTKMVAESKARANQAQHTFTQVTDSVTLEVKQAFLELETAGKNISVAQLAILQAEENYRLNQERYRVQVATSTEVLDAQTLLTQAHTNYFNALSQYAIAKARVARAVGEGARHDF